MGGLCSALEFSKWRLRCGWLDFWFQLNLELEFSIQKMKMWSNDEFGWFFMRMMYEYRNFWKYIFQKSGTIIYFLSVWTKIYLKLL